MTRLCTRCGHPLGGAPFRPDPANAGRAHTDCNDETADARYDPEETTDV